ncbi:AlpA family phage regulatory protein [Buttiauxella warmboldiae]|uniref:AlpA family phage regulatory protein n=1 Tax=Buttiauxella warmboldiae TaxID=82993 RepID=A0A3N5E882_9ENTR|nr:AlpA family phage regulatory protein [Buttiauxella warmboldiae]RPH28333.1 AlpA family phage regulatory protein [Buttiauxella warmboldiae]
MKTYFDDNNPFPENGNVRMHQVARFLAMSESSVYRKMKEPNFPQPTRRSSRLVVFDAAEIRQWRASQNQHSH